MIRRQLRSHLGRLLGVLLFLTVAGRASGQNENELPASTEDLAAQVADLQSEAVAARERIQQLEQRITELEKELNAARKSTEQPPAAGSFESAEVVTIDESSPAATPRALFNALVESYQEFTPDLEIGEPDSGARRNYLKKLEGWAASVNREFRSQITWHVQFSDARTEGRTRRYRFVALDPVTASQLGDPFDVRLSRPLIQRLAELEARDELDLLIMKGTLLPNIVINPARELPGPFNHPRLIGPFAEFGITVQAASLRSARDLDEAVSQADTDQPPPSPAVEKP